MDGTQLAEAWGRTCIGSAYLRKQFRRSFRHANVSTTNTYYIKSAADDTRTAMAKLESLVIGNESAAQSLVSGNNVATDAADTKAVVIQ